MPLAAADAAVDAYISPGAAAADAAADTSAAYALLRHTLMLRVSLHARHYAR